MDEPKLDKVLVERVRNGDKEAFSLLVDRYQHRIAKTVSKFVYNHAEIEDITQEVFIKAYRAVGNFRGDSAFYTWLYRIAVNTAKNHLVSRGRRPPSTDVDAVDAQSFESGGKLRETATPDSLLFSEELADIVYQSMDSLPDELKKAITLREIEGMSYEEIANVMACPIGTVRSRIFRAREVIDKAIAEVMDITD